ncbi:Transglutaminase-like superfamily protein [Agreia bicolorata]|uniref:Transglutaminase-like superfamily protein n=1 Tax=Agreia bicolorata TaxID=110935 RepID=A0A1T4XPJ7_9MICO|nr:transglutaminase-like domain-containing protein [Agreia bicolorata]SKA91028.1 Transglutaminase-like superfamily protein [Agreia bicolorata]
MRRPPAFDRRSAAADTVFFVVLMAVAASTLWPIYQTPRLIVLAAAALALGVVVAWTGALLRWPGYVVFAASVAVFLVFGVALAVPGRAIFGVLPSFDGVRDLVTGTALAWKQLVTVDLPVSSYQSLLAPALVLLLGGTVLGLSLVLRSRRGDIAVLIPVAVAVTGLALGPEVAWSPFVPAVAFLVVAITWMTWRARRARRRAIALLAGQTESDARVPGFAPDRRGSARPVIAAVIVLAVAVVAGVSAAGVFAPQGSRDVVRSAVERPFDPRDYASPLSGFRSYWSAEAAGAPLFDIEGLPDGARIRLAALDTYNGVVYSVGDESSDSASGFFARVPSTIDRTGESGTPVSATIVVSGYRGVWLPTTGDVERVTFSGSRASQLADAFYYNRTSNTAAVLGGVREGDSYTVEAIVPSAPDDDELRAAQPGDASVPQPSNVPDAVATAVADDTQGLDAPGEKLAAVVDAIKASGYISHGTDDGRPYSRSGHSADRITELLTAPLMLGDAEQYATTVALMADELGFPARVVLGFAPPAGTSTVTGSDVSAWVEVDLAGYGWVAIDATPEDRPIPEKLPDTKQQVSRPQVVIPPPPAADDTPVEPNRPEADQKKADDPDAFWPAVLGIVRVVGVVALVVLIVFAPVILIAGAKLARRRRRRRRPDAVSRIAGGWQELVDTGLDYGYDVPATATRLEAARAVGAVDLQTFARRADAAVFADERIDVREADQYWSDLAILRVAWAREYTRWQRIRAATRLRSLSARSGASGRGGERRG